MSETFEELRERLRVAGQEHVLGHWDRLNPRQRAGLLEQCATLDMEEIARLGRLLREPAALEASGDFSPAEVFPLQRSAAQAAEAREAAEHGRELLRRGRVGFLVVAGGQGSRLGFEGPKGLFPVGPVTGRSLFEWHARRLLAARDRHGAPVRWYVMTAATNDAETRAFFAQRGYFGLAAEDVFFFQQKMLPALDTEGRILLSAPDSLFLAPNGHGGTLEALRSSGALAHAAERGIECFSYFQIDNPLARPGDPVFLGLHARGGAQMSSKVVDKRDAWEKVGVIGRRAGKLGCIEYSDLPDGLRHAQDAAGRLLFRAGNIAIHAIDRRFVERLTEGHLRLPWHLARKRITTVGKRGERVDVEGVKFETFVFDALGECRTSLTLEVERALEFSPIKNKEGLDSPQTARADLTRLFRGWVERVGLALPSPDEAGHHPLEVDPRLAETEEDFLAAAPERPHLHEGGHLYQ